jgi:protein MpaA
MFATASQRFCTTPRFWCAAIFRLSLSLGFAACSAPNIYAQENAPNRSPFEPFRWGLGAEASRLSVFEPLGAASAAAHQQSIQSFCDALRKNFRSLGWREDPCEGLAFRFDLRSEEGHPLVYVEYTDDRPQRLESASELQTTLILGGVHPDEITPVHLAFAFARKLRQEPDSVRGARVIIAPLVNPDGFFTQPRTRTNRNGIDLNRNFATADWWNHARNMWHERRRRDPRHFPGMAPNTEQGTRFQADLIRMFEPDKILTIHAPLAFLDFDGPGDRASVKAQNSPFDTQAAELAKLISRRAQNYRIIDYSYFPGSLGNFAGRDRRIPTITVELNTSDPRQAAALRNRFFPGLRAAIGYRIKSDRMIVSQDGDVAIPNL